jgi:hypothetical protein
MRLLVAALLAANALVLAWVLGWVGPGTREREPERLGAQVTPNAVEVVGNGADSAPATTGATAPRAAPPQPPSPQAAPPAPQGEPAPPAASAPGASQNASPNAGTGAAVPVAGGAGERVACLEVGPLAAGEVAAAERALRDLQSSGLAWTQQKSERGGVFIVYLGKFPDEAALAKRRDELRKAQIPFDELRSSSDLQPGLSFGRYENRAAADTALDELRNRGVKAARVVTITPPATVTMLRVERAEPALATRLSQLALPPLGTGFKPCAGNG